jgi:general secretion pathway protein L
MICEFFLWWFGQLADLLPSWLRRRAMTAADAMVITPVGGLGRGVDAVAVGLRRNGNETPVGQFNLAGTGLPELPRAPGRTIVLRLSAADILAKTMTLPLAAGRELRQVLGFEMDRETPFKPDEIYWNHRLETADRQKDRLSVRLLLVPKVSLASLLGALDQVGVRPSGAEIADGPDAGSCLPFAGDGSRQYPTSSRLVRVAALCCATLALATVMTPLARQEIVLAALHRDIAIGRAVAAEANSLRQEIDRLSGSADFVERERDKAGRPLAVLAAATDIMPDDTYLTEIELRGRKVTLTGQSAAASRLIGALSAAGGFRNPGFAAPVTRIEALHSELFTIIAEAGS